MMYDYGDASLFPLDYVSGLYYTAVSLLNLEGW